MATRKASLSSYGWNPGGSFGSTQTQPAAKLLYLVVLIPAQFPLVCKGSDWTLLFPPQLLQLGTCCGHSDHVC